MTTEQVIWVSILWVMLCFSVPFLEKYWISRRDKEFDRDEEDHPNYIMSNKPSKKQKAQKEIPLSAMAKTFFVDHKMPCCGAERFSEGPEGGITINIMCSGCGEKYNVCLGGLSQSEGPYPKIIEHIS